MIDALNPAHVAWCRRHFALMREGGMWGVPRCGMIYQKRGGALVLTDVMPHNPAMDMSAAALREYQTEEFIGTKLHFGAAGVPVQDATGLMP